MSMKVNMCDKPSGNLSHNITESAVRDKLPESLSHKNPLLSIIIPCYNCSKFLDKCVQSLTRQNADKHYEIILVNDGSNDESKTLNKCKELTNKFDNKKKFTIKYLNLEKNAGLSEARNTGIKAAKGKFVTFVDSDDWATKDFVSAFVNTTKKYPNSEIIVSGITEIHIDENDNTVQKKDFIPTEGNFNSKEKILQASIELEKNTLLGYACTKAYKKQFIEQNELKFEKFHLIEDIMFNINAFEKTNEFTSIAKSMYLYRREAQSAKQVNNTSITHEYLDDYFECFYHKIDTMYSWYKLENFLTSSVKTILANDYVRYTFSAIWRNMDKRSGLDKQKQIDWIKDFYELKMTKKLLDYAKPEGFIAKKMAIALQSKKISKVMRIASIINFVHDHMSWLLVKLRQSR